MGLKFAPKELFDQMLDYMVIPTFDLVIEHESKVLFVKRKIAPYADVWALPGLRMYKSESIDDSLKRIAKDEVGLDIDSSKKVYLGQMTVKFNEEHERQDLSTGYLIKVDDSQEVILNNKHFSAYAFSNKLLPDTGELYCFYFNKWLELH